MKIFKDGQLESTIELQAIKTAVELIDNIVSGSEAQVDVVTSALPSGASTEATLASIKTAVEVIDNFISGSKGLVTEDNSAAIKTALEIIDNAIAGNEMQVDIVGSLPAGTNAIGKLAANSGVDIGDVDVTSLPDVTISPVVDNPEFWEDTSFVTGDSPVTLDLNTALSKNAVEGHIVNDGGGNFSVQFSSDGAAFGDSITVKTNESLAFEDISVDSLKITWIADTAYRVIAI